MSRLSIDLTDEQHKRLKAIAAIQGKTIKQYSLEKLFSGKSDAELSDEEKAWEEFKEFIGNRVDEAMASPPSKRSILDIAEDGLRRYKAA